MFIGLFMLASCQKEQSELTLSSLPSQATITGTLKYDAGAYKSADNTLLTGYELPAANRTISVTIATSQYVSGTAQGDQYFTATTDAEGKFSINIPVSNKEISATVSVVPFYADYYLESTNLTTVTFSNALYKVAAGQPVTLSQNDVEVVELVAECEYVPYDIEFNQTVTVNGAAVVDAFVSDNAGGWNEGTAPFASQPVFVTASVDGYKIKMQATTDALGNYTVNMNLPSDCWDYPSSVTFNTSIESTLGNMNYYYKSSGTWMGPQVIQVVYSASAYSNGSATLTSANKFSPVQLSRFTVDTDPVNLVGLPQGDGGYPFGWR